MRDVLLQALQRQKRDILCLDADFESWPWSDAAVLEALHAWSGPGRQLRLLALDFETLKRAHPRFVRWRQTHSHLVQAAQFEASEWQGGRLPQAVLLVPEQGVLRLLARDSWRAVLSPERRDELAAREWFDAVTQRSSESFGASTLGL
ncbi:hypothetical protein [Roseateles aquae]|uniref:hypothetical protein n=1 Tax=Roseateles aquae TaxID=3077235 RepID=UPI0028E1E6B8|nr:hypothetical protein [Paucibacter sp. APW11]